MGNYVLEIQGSAILTTYHNEEEVLANIDKQDFYQKCSYAAVSQVPRHTIVLMREDGNIIQKQEFFHPTIEESEEE